MEQISRQISRVEELTADPDSGTNFALVVMQTELERYKFLVRSYLRARLAKLDAHTLHYLQGHSRAVDDGSDSQAVQSSAGGQRKIRLSPHELAYATHRQALLHAHFLSSFLGVFPPQQQHLNDRAGNVNMVDAPDDESAVFVRLLREDARFAVVRGVESDMKDLGGKVGDIFIVRWRDARDLVKSGGAELV